MKTEKKMLFYGGMFGAFLPFICLIAIMILLTVTGHNGIKYCWSAGLAAICVSLILAKDKKDVHKISISALQDPMFGTMTLIFLLAGILSFLLRDSGLIDGLIWLCTTLHVNPAFMPIATFLICVVISTACGTQGGTISAVTPIMFPLAVALGCDEALMLGAIISGAVFGDNLAPISDTTIASSGAFHADVKDVVKSRIKYSIIAASIAGVLFIIFGLSTTEAASVATNADSSAAMSLIMLIIPVIMIIMMLRGAELVPVLLTCNLLGVLLNLVCGFLTVEELISTEEGPIVKGMEGMIGVIVFTVFIMIENGFLKASGLFEVILEKLGKICKSARQTELVSMVFIAIVVMITASGTVSIIVAGPIVYELFKKFNINRHRGANYLDGTACSVGAILPWNNSVLIMLGLAVATGIVSENFSPLNFMPYSFHPIVLFLVYVICAITGLFRKEDEKKYADV